MLQQGKTFELIWMKVSQIENRKLACVNTTIGEKKNKIASFFILNKHMH
jgi:hypothetical protein